MAGRRRSGVAQDLALAAPALVLILAFLVPIAALLRLGVEGPDGGLTGEHLARFLTDPFYLGIVYRTVSLSLIITAICVLLGFPLAYVMARVSPRLRLWLMILLVLPLMTSVVVRSFGWLVLLGRGGPVATLLWNLDLVRRNFTLMQTEAAIVIGMVQVLLPFTTLSILGVVTRIDGRLEEAARTLGAGFASTLRLVVLPLALPGILAGGLLAFTLSVSSFVTPSLLGGVRLPVMAGSVYESATKTLDWNFAAAQSAILLVGILILLVPYAMLSRRRHG